MAINSTQHQIKLCAFDFDDTLVKTKETKFEAIKHLANSYDIELSNDDINKHWGISHKELFSNLLNLKGAELDNALRQYQELDALYPNRSYEGASEIISNISKVVPVVIISSCSSELMKSQLRQCSFDLNHLDRIYGFEDTQFHKPDPRIFNEVKRDYPNINPDEVCYIGDGFHDFVAATNAGFNFIGINRDPVHSQKILEHGGVVSGSYDGIYNQIEPRIGGYLGPSMTNEEFISYAKSCFQKNTTDSNGVCREYYLNGHALMSNPSALNVSAA